MSIARVQAYYRNARDCHPDKHPGDTVMRDKFQEAGTAKYSVEANKGCNAWSRKNTIFATDVCIYPYTFASTDLFVI